MNLGLVLYNILTCIHFDTRPEPLYQFKIDSTNSVSNIYQCQQHCMVVAVTKVSGVATLILVNKGCKQ